MRKFSWYEYESPIAQAVATHLCQTLSKEDNPISSAAGTIVTDSDGKKYLEIELPGYDKSEIQIHHVGTSIDVVAESKSRGCRRFNKSLASNSPGKISFVEGLLRIELVSTKTRLEISP
jgi:HSP20 family molecular chaperone IbpA